MVVANAKAQQVMATVTGQSELNCAHHSIDIANSTIPGENKQPIKMLKPTRSW